MKLLFLSLLIFISGCAIPVKMMVIPDPEEVARQERTKSQEISLQEARSAYEKKERLKEQWEKRRLIGYNKIQKLRDKRLEKKELLRMPKLEVDIILQSFQDSGIILKSFEKIGCSLFDIASFLNEYRKDDIDGFCDYLAEKYPFNTLQRWELDRKIFEPVKRNHLLLERLNEKNK